MPDLSSLQNQLRQWRDYYSTIPGGEQQLYQKVAEYAYRQNLSPDVVAQVIQGVAPNPGMWDGARVQGLMNQYVPANSQAVQATGFENQLRQLRDHYSKIPGSEEQFYRDVIDYAQRQGLSADVVARTAQGVAPNPGAWTTERVQSLMDQYGAPQYGLSGATSAVRQGLGAATNAIQGGTQNAAGTINRATQNASSTLNRGLQSGITALQGGQQSALAGLADTQGRVSGLFNEAQAQLQPFSSRGVQANDLQAALSGVMGPDAQKAAFAQYQESPGVDYARSQAEKAITRNASATGGLGGGNVLSELMRNAVGTYLQDFGNQFARIGSVADRGLSAASTGSALKAQEAGIQAGLGQFGAQIPLETSSQIANLHGATANNIGGMEYGAGNTIGGLQYNTGTTLGGMNFDAGNTIGGMRFQTGQDLANSVNSTTSALSSLINQQGAGMTDIMGNTTTNLNALYQQASAGDANAMEQLAALLGNVSTQNASMVGGLPIIPGQQTNYLGQLGQVTGGLGGLLTGIAPYMTQPATQSVYTPSANSPSANYYTNYGAYA
jgi:hypothetical protein